MTRYELLVEIRKLPESEQLRLSAEITLGLATSRDTSRQQSLGRKDLRGILKVEGQAPTDDELRDEYTDYLIQKYS